MVLSFCGHESQNCFLTVSPCMHQHNCPKFSILHLQHMELQIQTSMEVVQIVCRGERGLRWKRFLIGPFFNLLNKYNETAIHFWNSQKYKSRIFSMNNIRNLLAKPQEAMAEMTFLNYFCAISTKFKSIRDAKLYIMYRVVQNWRNQFLSVSLARNNLIWPKVWFKGSYFI